MKQHYLEELIISMYPSMLLHNFAVNGKVSGSIYAVGEISDVVPIIHGPRGCGYHYRHSARRRHYPYFDVVCSALEEKDIIYGGEEKLYKTIIETHEKYNPKLIVIIPTPISDIIQDDIEGVAARVRREKNINIVAIKSELFSHRDKSYAAKRLREVSKQKFNQGKNIGFDIKGCGYTEMLYAFVNDVMKKQEVKPLSVNIETIGWGASGKIVIREIEETLKKVGVNINAHFPSGTYEEALSVPSASLNIVRRLKWARRMRDKFNTPFLQINTTGRYSGLEGIENFYNDIGQALGIENRMSQLINEEKEKAKEKVKEAKEKLKQYKVLIITRDIQSMPYLIKKYKQDYSLNIVGAVVLLSQNRIKNLHMTEEVINNFMERINDAVNIYSKDTKIYLNPSHSELIEIKEQCDNIVGTDDYTFENLGLPMVHPRHEDMSLSFESYVRSIKRMAEVLERGKRHSAMLLNKMNFDCEYYPLLNNKNTIAAKEMWNRMWLNRKDK